MPQIKKIHLSLRQTLVDRHQPSAITLACHIAAAEQSLRMPKGSGASSESPLRHGEETLAHSRSLC